AGGGLQRRARHLASGIDLPAISLDLRLGKVEADGATGLSELDGQRQTHIPQTDDGDDIDSGGRSGPGFNHRFATDLPVGYFSQHSSFSGNSARADTEQHDL